VVGAAPKAVGQFEQDAADLLRLLFLQRDDVVVDLDSGQRLEKQACTAGRSAVHDPRNSPAMFGSHDEDVAAVAIGDAVVLKVLRRVALSQERLECAPELRTLTPQAVAN